MSTEKGGAPSLLQRRRDLSLGKFKAAYKMTGSAAGVARLLDVSKSAALKYLKMAGVEVKPRGQGVLKGKYVPKWHRSCVAEWLRRHPTVKLPRSPKEIAFITGCSYDAVAMYLRRRRAWDERHENATVVRVGRGKATCPGSREQKAR